MGGRAHLLAAAFVLAAAAARGEGTGRVFEVPSGNVPGSVRTLVVLPPSYDREPARRYPVVYFLHDFQGSETTLRDRGVAGELLAEMRLGALREAILVAPRGVDTWFVDSFDGKTRFGRFLEEELVPWVDARFRTVPVRASRAAAGISMGGYGALRWGFVRPGLFAAVGGLSPAIQQLDMRGVMTMPFFLRPMVTDVFGKDPLHDVMRKNDLYDILLSNPGSAAAAPEVFVRCGTEDRYRLHEVAGFLSKFLTAMGVKSTFVLERGGHAWGYWRTSLPALLRTVIGRLAP